jgi:RNA polymerase sigma factor (sigma-70 family)
VDEALNSWFAREILVHEAALVRYLMRTWPNKDDVSDLRQEIYVRVYEAAKRSRPTFAKSFLFTTARHLMTDRARRGRVVSIEAAGDLADLNVLVDEISPERRLDARQELKQLAHAFGLLPPKCREVVWLRKVDGIPQSEVAQLLGISVRTVEFQVQKGMRILAHALFGEGAGQKTVAPHSVAEQGSEDGIQ